MQKLIFIYNAESGLFNSLTDFAHKIISPSTYNCQLCAITYGNFTVKKEWKAFIESLDIKTEFCYRDEFLKTFGTANDLDPPAVYINNGDRVELFISSTEINASDTLEDLQKLISERLINFKVERK
jgi:hypothetical protein